MIFSFLFQRIRNRSNLLDSDESMLEELCELNKDEEEVGKFAWFEKAFQEIYINKMLDVVFVDPSSLQCMNSLNFL